MDHSKQITEGPAVDLAQFILQIQNKSYHFIIKQYMGKIAVKIGEFTSKGKTGRLYLPLELFSDIIEALKELENYLDVNRPEFSII